MITAMFLSHLIGDYILQTDAIALWKSREMRGVLVHGLIVLFTTWIFMLPFDGSWWLGLIIIGGGHIFIDVANFWLVQNTEFFRDKVSPLNRFIIDQIAHISLILLALGLGGYLHTPTTAAWLERIAANDRFWLYALGYAFITMPAWVLLKFSISGLVHGRGPNFTEGANKYVSILERLLITTFVAMGQIVLVPLVAAPRLLVEGPKIKESQQFAYYLAELFASVILAIIVGLILSQI
ncbi:MAG TPA: DUF3307 domain-containing protein [Anaerolineae bacterium]|nr:DUF3307 domain-containing protein [Anaerolineae bacterium]